MHGRTGQVSSFSALTSLVVEQKGHPGCKSSATKKTVHESQNAHYTFNFKKISWSNCLDPCTLDLWPQTPGKKNVR